MTWSFMHVLASVFVAFSLCGCGGARKSITTTGTTTPWSTWSIHTTSHSSGASTAETTATTTATALPKGTNIWQWRSDMTMEVQQTYDLSGNMQPHSLYGGCWENHRFNPETLVAAEGIQYGPVDQQLVEHGQSFGTYDGETGLTLLNKRGHADHPGCLMRKTRTPIDLSIITRIELDVFTSGPDMTAPWYAVWLAPAIYSDSMARSAEIDLMENLQYTHLPNGMDHIQSAFSMCNGGACTPSYWTETRATRVRHHLTVEIAPGETIRVYRCPNQFGTNRTTCKSNRYAEIRLSANFPVWDKNQARDRYAKYWLVSDLWFTTATPGFKMSVDNVHFFKEDNTEWYMALNGEPPSFEIDRQNVMSV